MVGPAELYFDPYLNQSFSEQKAQQQAAATAEADQTQEGEK